MPTYRTITLSLISQFDILTIPEYAPPTPSPSSSSHTPALIDRNLSLVSVYIPTYPSSQFWLSYSISPPHPPHALYYFKLLINGAHIVSWGCGEEDGFKGKTMFGVFDSGESWLGERGMEKRVFCFGREEDCFDGVGGVMEVRVCRARGRQRTRPEVDEFGELERRGDGVKRGALQRGSKGGGGVGVNLINAGILEDKLPKRYYKYALLDPTDQPFATFRYYYRTWDQLEALGVIPPTSEDAEEADDPLSSGPSSRQSPTKDTSSENDTHSIRTAHKSTTDLTTPSLPSRATLTPPPTAVFAVPQSTLPPSPMKHNPGTNQHQHQHKRTTTPSPTQTEERKRLERLRRTPSPTKVAGENLRDASSSWKGRAGSVGLLRGVVASAVRRRGPPSPGPE